MASHSRSWAFDFFLGISSGWDFFETSEKIWGHVAGEGEFENRGQEPQGPPKRAQKFFENFFVKGIGLATAGLGVGWRWRYGCRGDVGGYAPPLPGSE